VDQSWVTVKADNGQKSPIETILLCKYKICCMWYVNLNICHQREHDFKYWEILYIQKLIYFRKRIVIWLSEKADCVSIISNDTSCSPENFKIFYNYFKTVSRCYIFRGDTSMIIWILIFLKWWKKFDWSGSAGRTLHVLCRRHFLPSARLGLDCRAGAVCGVLLLHYAITAPATVVLQYFLYSWDNNKKTWKGK